MGKTTNIIYTVHSEIKQKTQTHKQKKTTKNNKKKQYKKKVSNQRLQFQLHTHELN